MIEEVCPHCGSNQFDDEASRQNTDDPSPYWRTIGIEIPGLYDGCLYWQCPDCGGRWHRWPTGHYLRVRAERYVNTP